ncbi:hypothetical protein KO507_03395, partial [Gilvimarinus agarilyticus]|nr:hypothetical protein [Gilvimarinus agarilyticus]MDO6569850.1 hypothetical protein [Gilvimarinus sp. 2_MG-2023]
LNQPIILPDPARKAATVAQALQKHLSNAYSSAVRDTFNNKACAQTKATCIHRAITGLGLLLLRSYQLYTPTPHQVWSELHTLYRLAELEGLSQELVKDPMSGQRGVRTIEQAYLRVILLAAGRPNQLRQNDLFNVYNALEELSAKTSLNQLDPDTAQNLYSLMLDSDTPPVYRTRLPLYESQDVRQLDTTELCQCLNDMVTDPERMKALKLNTGLLGHAINAWQQPALRNFERTAGDGQLEVTVGLTNLHFHVADETPFNLFIRQSSGLDVDDEDSIYQKRSIKLKDQIDPNQADPWGEAFDVAKPRFASSLQATTNIDEALRRSTLMRYRGQHPIFSVEVVDVSAGGYCLEWHTESPVQLKAGEILGV